MTNLSSCYSIDGDFDRSGALIRAATLLNGDSSHNNILLAKSIYYYEKEDWNQFSASYAAFINSRFLFIRPSISYGDNSDIINAMREKYDELQPKGT